MKSLGAHTIALPLPAWVIGTYDAAGKPNAMTASWTGVCCSDPPCVYFSARKSRYTYECVTASRAFTINIPDVGQVEVTDYLGTVSGRKLDKLSAAGLEVRRAQHIEAPYIVGFPLIIECRLAKTIELGSHTMFVGKIVDVKCDEAILGPDGKPDGSRLRPFIYSTGDGAYYAVVDKLGKGYQLGRSVATPGEQDRDWG